VATRCGFTAKRVKRAIGRQLCQCLVRNPQADLERTAELMIANWNEYCLCNRQGLLRFVWGPAAFFDEGAWGNSDAWPVDEEKRRVKAEARLGVAG
jgi:hypothetical protein